MLAVADLPAPQYRWISVSARTGRRIASLPGLVCDSVGVVLGGEATASADLPLADRCPPNWEQAVREGGACLVLVDSTDDNRPVWGGLVLKSQRDESDTVSLSLVTWEHLLDRVYVGDDSFASTSQTQIVADLVTHWRLDGSVPLVVEASASSVLRDRTYLASGDKSLAAVMGELMDVEDGPEFTVTWRHLTDLERFVPVLTIADRIGSVPPAGLAPAATFRLPGSVQSFTLSRSYARDEGANVVTATSNPDPQSQTRPQSAPAVYADPDRPVFEERFAPSTSITQQATLDAHALARLAVRQHGSSALALSARTDTAPRLGRTWGVGDVVGYDIKAPSVPLGLKGTVRVLGWTLDIEAGLVTPVLGGLGG